MSRAHPPSQADSRPVPARSGELDHRNDAGAFYIGLGDRFDDDRRLVRVDAPAPRPAIEAR